MQDGIYQVSWIVQPPFYRFSCNITVCVLLSIDIQPLSIYIYIYIYIYEK